MRMTNYFTQPRQTVKQKKIAARSLVRITKFISIPLVTSTQPKRKDNYKESEIGRARDQVELCIANTSWAVTSGLVLAICSISDVREAMALAFLHQENRNVVRRCVSSLKASKVFTFV